MSKLRFFPQSLHLIYSCLLVLPAAALQAEGGPPQGPPPAKVRLADVRIDLLQQRRQVLGELRAVKKSTIAAEVEARITQVKVTEGQFVKAGEIIAELDGTWIKNDLKQIDVQLAENLAAQKEAQAMLRLAERNRDQQKELAKTTIRTIKEYHDAIDRAEASESVFAQIEVARERIKVAKARLLEQQKRLQIVAPFQGYVVAKHMEAGDYATLGSGVATVVYSGKLTAALRVPETMIDHIRVGNEISVLISPLNIHVKGPVRYVVPEILSGARSFPVLIRLDDLGGRLKPGMSIASDIPTSEKKKVMTVPRDAVLRINGETFVWKGLAVGPEQLIASKLPVRVLFGHENRVAIEPRGTLLVTEQVVIEGGERIFFPGQPLMVMPDTPKPVEGAQANTMPAKIDSEEVIQAVK